MTMNLANISTFDLTDQKDKESDTVSWSLENTI